MTDYVDASDEKESAAAEIAEVVGASVENRFTQGAKKEFLPVLRLISISL